MTLSLIAFLFLAGLTGGILSAVAGGASFVTFPALIFLGLPPITANATNFVALLLAQPAALVTAFRSEVKASIATLGPSLAIATLGGLVGSLLLVLTPEVTFKSMIPYLMGVATIAFAGGPRIRRWAKEHARAELRTAGVLYLLLLLLLSIYTGYFGAGVGMMLLAMLAIFGEDDIHTANAVKNLLITASSIVSVIVYAASAAIAWPEALVMMVGATLGGALGGWATKIIPQTALRSAISIFGVVLTIYYFFKY